MLEWIRNLVSGKPSPDRFAAMAKAELQAIKPGISFTLDRDQFTLRASDGVVISLRNVYLDYCRAERSKRKGELQRFARGLILASTTSSWEDAKPKLLPVLRHLGGVDLVRISNNDLAKPLSNVMTWKPFSSLLGVCVAIDMPDAIQQVGTPDLDRWGLTLDQALEVAIDNLRHKAPPSFVQHSKGLYLSTYDDFFDAARILLQELVWQLPLDGTPVAMVPNRTCLLVCGSNDEGALRAMVEVSRKVLTEQSRPLSPEMFRIEGTTWTEWIPPGVPGQMLRRLQLEQRTADYRDQAEAIEAAHEKSGTDVFIASHTVIERNADKALISYAVLPKDVDTWLPMADVLVLKETPEDEGFIVDWEVFMEHGSHLLQRLDFVLPRFRALGHPNGECLEKLRAKASTFERVFDQAGR